MLIRSHAGPCKSYVLRHIRVWSFAVNAVSDPGLQIRVGRGGGGHPDSKIRGDGLRVRVRVRVRVRANPNLFVPLGLSLV